jgi:hypothetical protein
LKIRSTVSGERPSAQVPGPAHRKILVVAGPIPKREKPPACHFCGRPAEVRAHWRGVTLHPGDGLATHTTEVGVPRCTACRRRNRILASSTIVAFCASLLVAAFFVAGLAVSKLGLSGENAMIVRLVAIFAVLAAGLFLLRLAVPAWNWRCYRKDPEVAWWRGLGWTFLDYGRGSR